MLLVYKVQYKSSVLKDLKNIDRPVAKRILDSIEKDLALDPSKGQPLEGDLKGLFKYRIANYRVIFTRLGEDILVLRIGHRKKVYKKK